MATVTLTTKNAEIISTGSVIIPKNDHVDFKINDLIFRIKSIIEKDPKGKLTESRVNSELVKDNENIPQRYEIKFINTNELKMSVPSTTFSRATIEGQKLYLDYAIKSINVEDSEGNEDKLFFYTWKLVNE